MGTCIISHNRVIELLGRSPSVIQKVLVALVKDLVRISFSSGNLGNQLTLFRTIDNMLTSRLKADKADKLLTICLPLRSLPPCISSCSQAGWLLAMGTDRTDPINSVPVRRPRRLVDLRIGHD